MKIKGLSALLDSVDFTISKAPEKDTLNYWIRPRKLEVDSLMFEVSYSTQKDTVKVRIKPLEIDSLSFEAVSTNLKLNSLFKLRANIPLNGIDASKTIVMDKDSLFLESSLSLDSLKNTDANLKFNTTEGNRYKITFLPVSYTHLRAHET